MLAGGVIVMCVSESGSTVCKCGQKYQRPAKTSVIEHNHNENVGFALLAHSFANLLGWFPWYVKLEDKTEPHPS